MMLWIMSYDYAMSKKGGDLPVWYFFSTVTTICEAGVWFILFTIAKDTIGG